MRTATLKKESGEEICQILNLKTIRGVRNRADKILTDMGLKGRFVLDFGDHTQNIQII